MATAASSTCCQFLTPVWSPGAHPVIFPPISKPTHFQPFLANASLQNSAFSPTPTTSFYSPLSVKAQAATPGETQPMLPPYNVLITGSSKGIGYALAKEFLKAGDNVVICSRSAERVESAVKSLREEYEEQRVWGTQCDIREAQDVKNLVLFAQKNLGDIDIWINNAGSNAYSYKPLAEASDEDLIEVVSTNTLGLMICCREAIKMMLQQPRGGHIFNIDGAGSDGRPTPSQEWLQLIFSCLVQPQSRPSFSSMFWQNQLKWLQNTWSQISGPSQQMDHGSQLIFGSSLD
ncbi:PREDICTED: chlorophyll(ide) b reductase NOL, chloroplastic isoform X2 [Theobroma cacao]|uniref:Chlorophyll(Ide) b reductase NOL, chloroplastic isoform X2 n=1 Tax=Theobroma cacao TaxID=3641 RepID=A0AB32X034_THECC|nr:PREDICTED: chlorophyll(ide) b reductase NOL, chloroplastic isoform X2 [Theobroma cacao]